MSVNNMPLENTVTINNVIPLYMYRALWLNVVGIGGLLLICGYAGLVMHAFYHNCDPLTPQQVTTKDQLFPLFVMQVICPMDVL